MSNEELALNDERIEVVAKRHDPLDLIARLIESGKITSESVGVAKELFALDREMRMDRAEQDYAAAFSALQKELGTFTATRAVPMKDNKGTKYTYLPYEEIMRAVQPLAEKHGFSISFSTDFAEARIIQTCTLQHISGHHRDFKAFVRAGAGPHGATETQADGAAMTYAKRYALCNALNIVVERDTDGADARNEGGPITFEQAETLRQLVAETGSDEAKFLKFAGVEVYAEIGSNRYQELFNQLQRKLTRK